MSDYEDTAIKPPSAPESERALLSALLVNPEEFGRVLDLLAPSDFHDSARGAVFGAMLELHRDGEPCDPTTIITRLKPGQLLEGKTPINYVTELALGFGNTAALEYNAKEIRDKALRRRALRAQLEIPRYLLESDSFTEAAQAAIQPFADLAREVAMASPSHKELLAEVANAIEARCDNPHEVQGIATGLRDLDDLTTGLHPGNLIVIAGRPAMGKTQLALNIAHNVCARWEGQRQRSAAIFSLEMTRQEIMERLLTLQSKVQGQRIRKGLLSQVEREALFGAIAQLDARELTIFDEEHDCGTVLKVEAKLQRLINEGKKPDAVIIDHLSFLQGAKADNRNLEVEAICRDLKRLAVRLRLPIILIAQLSRACEARQDKRPMLSDLRDSGGVEQHADIVMFIYRDDYYRTDSIDTGTCELLIAKHRSGPPGRVGLIWRPEMGLFMDHDGPLPSWRLAREQTPAKGKGYAQKSAL